MNCDALFAGEMIWIARLLTTTATVVLMTTAAFVVASTIAHMRSGRWLTRAGTFEVPEQRLRDQVGNRARAGDASQDGHGELEELRVRLAISSELIEKFMYEHGR
jgi:hypothetical protein